MTFVGTQTLPPHTDLAILDTLATSPHTRPPSSPLCGSIIWPNLGTFLAAFATVLSQSASAVRLLPESAELAGTTILSLALHSRQSVAAKTTQKGQGKGSK